MIFHCPLKSFPRTHMKVRESSKGFAKLFMVRSGQSNSDSLLILEFILIQQQPISCLGSLSMLSSPSIDTHCDWGNVSSLECTSWLTKVTFSKPEQSLVWSKSSNSMLSSSTKSFFPLMTGTSRRSHCSSRTAQVTHQGTKVKDAEQRLQAFRSEVRRHC